MAILDQTKTIDEIPAFIKLCLYGPPGTGKTQFCADAPSPLWIDLERSSETFRAMPENYHTIPILSPKTVKDLELATDEFIKHQSLQTLVIDTGTRLQFFHMKELMVEAKAKNSSRDIDLPLFQEFRKSTEYLDKLFTTWQNMPKHLIIICHETEDYEGTDESRRLVRIRPDLTPGIAKRLNGLLNVTAYLEIKQGLGSVATKRILTVNPSGKIVAKNRLGIAATSIENPNLKQLFEKSFK